MENSGFKALRQKQWPARTFLFHICPFLPECLSCDFQTCRDLLHEVKCLFKGPVVIHVWLGESRVRGEQVQGGTCLLLELVRQFPLDPGFTQADACPSHGVSALLVPGSPCEKPIKKLGLGRAFLRVLESAALV